MLLTWYLSAAAYRKGEHMRAVTCPAQAAPTAMGRRHVQSTSGRLAHGRPGGEAARMEKFSLDAVAPEQAKRAAAASSGRGVETVYRGTSTPCARRCLP